MTYAGVLKWYGMIYRRTESTRGTEEIDARDPQANDKKNRAYHNSIDMRTWIIMALFAGVILVMVNEYASTVPERVEYRYLPRDLDEYIRTAPVPTTVFGAMFTEYDAIPGQFDHVTT